MTSTMVLKEVVDNTGVFQFTIEVETCGKVVARVRSGPNSDGKWMTPVGEQHPDYVLGDNELMWDHLGGMGWELVTGLLRVNALQQGTLPGWSTTFSTPVQEYYIFKRPLPH